MLEPLHSKKRFVDTDSGSERALYKRPDVNLLDDRQWLYVQRRYRLSPRELQVAKHVCRGFPNEEVARCLKIRSGTVKTHLRNIYRRIHVTNKIGMLLTFVEQAAAFYDKNEVSHRITVVNRRQIEPDTESSDVPGREKQTGLQS
ncbi:MAG: LuxR C-terminal-related transcriptional regulator [Planctomycetota bacterium]